MAISERAAAAEPPFAPQHRQYLLDRAVDLDLAWREGVRSLTEDEAQLSVGNNRITGTALGFFYGRVPSQYARVQLDDREGNGKKTCAPAGVTPPPYIPSTVSELGAEPLFVVEAPAKALAMASNGFPNTIGCGGIYAGIFEKGTCKFQAALLPFLRATRAVYVLFDAGRVSKPQRRSRRGPACEGLPRPRLPNL